MELPSDIPRLRVLRVALRLALADVDQALADAEQREAAVRAEPALWVQWMRRGAGTGRHGVLHRTGCWAPGKPELRETDVAQLAAAPDVHLEECPVCRVPAP